MTSSISGRPAAGYRTDDSTTAAARQEADPAVQPANVPPALVRAEWPLQSLLELRAQPSAVPSARLHARQVLREWGMDLLTEPVELIVLELTTNGVQASEEATDSWYEGRWEPGRPPVRLSLCSDKNSVLIQVWDGNDRDPKPGEMDLEADGGRGLLLIEALSSEWGTYRSERSSGKVVWAITKPLRQSASHSKIHSGHGSQLKQAKRYDTEP